MCNWQARRFIKKVFAMTIMILTSDNLSSLKKLCSDTYPSLKSSHITEAIARGFGFGSHAALLSTLKASVKPKLKYAEFNQQRFRTWIHEKSLLPVDPFPLHALTNLHVPAFRRISGTPSSRLGRRMHGSMFVKNTIFRMFTLNRKQNTAQLNGITSVSMNTMILISSRGKIYQLLKT